MIDRCPCVVNNCYLKDEDKRNLECYDCNRREAYDDMIKDKNLPPAIDYRELYVYANITSSLIL